MTLQKKIVFMGSPLISSEYLDTLIDNKFNVIAVYTQPPRPKDRGMLIQKSPVHKKANKLNIPVYHPKTFQDKETIDTFINLKADLVVVMAYGKIIPADILSYSKFGFINVHLSLLPRWRGSSPVEYALLNGDKLTGITIFRLVQELDAGPILSSKIININDDINKESLFNKLNFIGKELLIKTILKYFDKKIVLQHQETKDITYANKISSNITKINFNDDVNIVHNKIRAFSPKPGAWFNLNNNRIKILKCSKTKNNNSASVILNKDFHIGCNGGFIIPSIIQKEGKKPMHIKDFLKGYKFTVGQTVNE